MNDSTFGARLKSARKAKGYTQKELAALIDAKHNSISNWENDQNKPDPDTIERLCTVLDISADYLLPSKSERKEVSLLEGIGSLAYRPRFTGKEFSSLLNAIPYTPMSRIPIIGSVRAGAGGLAMEEPSGYEFADVRNPDEYFFLRVVGDSMTPDINEGDLALIHKQPDVESGELAVAIIDGEEGTIKKIIKKSGSLVLQAFNPAHPPRLFIGEEMNEVQIVGKVVRTVRIW